MNQNKDIFDTLDQVGDALQDVGEGLQDIVESAVSSQNFRNLSQRVNEQIRNFQQSDMAKAAFSRTASSRTVKTGEPSRASQRTANTPLKEEFRPEKADASLYAKTTSLQAKDYLFTAGGIILLLIALSGLIGTGIFGLIFGSANTGGLIASAITGIAGAVLTVFGIKGLLRISRFKKIVKALGTNTYISISDIAKVLGRPVKDIKNDVKDLLDCGWFLEGHMDKNKTCLITSEETYKQYVSAQQQYEERTEQEKTENEKRAKYSKELQEVLDKGTQYISDIRKCNEEIPGEEISAKITKMEQIVVQIFKQAEAHPEVVSDLKRMMNYYLPTAIKLLQSYSEMDRQPVQGENIQNSKKEIEATLDTLNDAFAKLLDSIFQDTAWDVSTDISVLNTLLAQEGLKSGDF